MSNFDKTTSTSDVSNIDSEQLLTELTPEQAAVIEGGALGASTFGRNIILVLKKPYYMGNLKK